MTEEFGVVIARIKADASQLEQGLRKANGVVKQNVAAMSDSFKGLKEQMLELTPALSLVAFVEFGKSAFEAADRINDLAQRTGFLGSTLSALSIPLKQGGSNLDEFSASINRMNAMIGEAAKGTNEEAVKAFDGLGLSVKKLKELSPEQQFYQIASALNNVQSQSELTEKGMNIFGRSFATLIPLIKDSKGNVAAFVDEAHKLGDALTDEQLKRIDEMGDRWTVALERMKHSMLDLVPLIDKLSHVPEYIRAALIDIPQLAGQSIGARLRGGNPNVSEERPDSVSLATFMGKDQYGPAYRPPSARGDNKELLGAKEAAQAAKDRAKQIEDATRALDDYNRSLEQEGVLLGMSERDAASQEARFKVEEIARKGNITLTQEQIEASAELAATNYDLKKAQDEVNKSIAEAARFQQELHDKLSATLTDIAFKAGSAKEAMLDFATSIAKAAFEKRIAGPLADSLLGTGGSGGLLDGVFSGAGDLFGGFFADGGSPPVGKASVVGENGPEIFIPNTAGTILPNGAMGGTSVVIHQSFALNPGATEQTVAALRNLVPSIMSETKAAVFAELQRGGSGSKIAGLRN